MKFLITEPRIPGTYLSRQLINHWHRATQDHQLEFFTNLPYEIHGELLTRLWNQIRYGPPNTYIISETDFVIEPSFVEELSRWPWKEQIIMVPYVTRQIIQGQPVVIQHEDLIGPYFMAFNLDHLKVENWPPQDWLSQGGPFNDAANQALIHSRESGFADLDNIRLLDWEDIFPPLLSISYPGVGVHLFWARHFNDPSERRLMPELAYTVRDHVRECLKFLLHGADALSLPSEESSPEVSDENFK